MRRSRDFGVRSRLVWAMLPGLLAASSWLLSGCKTSTPVTATQAVLDSADQVLFGMTHYLTDAGVLRARVQSDTTYLFSNTQQAELRNVHVTFYDVSGRPTSTLTAKEGTQHWRTGDMEARGNVVVVRDRDGGTMRTELMYYSQVKNQVSSDKPFQFDSPDRHITGEGFTSDPEFKNISATRPTGRGGKFTLPNQ